MGQRMAQVGSIRGCVVEFSIYEEEGYCLPCRRDEMGLGSHPKKQQTDLNEMGFGNHLMIVVDCFDWTNLDHVKQDVRESKTVKALEFVHDLVD
jgi:hypothetical protein